MAILNPAGYMLPVGPTWEPRNIPEKNVVPLPNPLFIKGLGFATESSLPF